MEKIITLLQSWFMEHGITIILLFITGWVLSRFMKKIVTKIIRKIIPSRAFTSELEERKREDTLITIIKNFLRIFVWIAVFFGILYEVGVPIAPLLTGAGILGVAVGFGSQSLVKDVITGLFIIIENQFRIDDVVCIGSHCGTVEGMTLRVTKLRDVDGSIHYIPNGEIKITSNKSKDYSKIRFKIGVGYDTNIDVLEQLINKIGTEIHQDPEFGQYIIDTPKFLRIDDFLDSAINIQIAGTVEPRKQFLINGELRKRLKIAFDENSIEIPYPIQVHYNLVKD